MKKLKCLSLVMLVALMLTGCGGKDSVSNLNSPEKVVARYCDILVNGNYGDILDIADLPESEFITKDIINGAKANFRERFLEENEEAISCTYTMATEDDEKVSYKLVINESSTKTLDIKKSNNKAIIDDIYVEANIYSPLGSSVTVDNIDISKYKISETSNIYDNSAVEHYTITVLSDYNYSVKSSHPLLSTSQEANFTDDEEGLLVFFSYYVGYKNSPEKNGYGENMTEITIKEKYYNEIEKFVDETIVPIIKDVSDNKDISKYNQYFVDGDATILSNKINPKYLSDSFPIETISLYGENKVEILIRYAHSSSNGGSDFHCNLMIIRNGDNWKIESVR